MELLAACVWWWNPLFWYVRQQVRENAELACDAWVVDAIPKGRRVYAEASSAGDAGPRPNISVPNQMAHWITDDEGPLIVVLCAVAGQSKNGTEHFIFHV